MIKCDDFDAYPRIYLTFMYTLSILAPPVNLFAVFCIICKSTNQMGAFKWYLLLYQTMSSTSNFLYTTVTLPVVFFPLPMCYTGSWIAGLLDMSVHTAVILVIPFGTIHVSCTFCLFAYRIHLILPHNHFLRLKGNGHVYASVAFFAVYSVPTIAALIDSSPDQNAAKRWILSEYSCAASVINVSRLHIYTPDSIRHFMTAVTILAVMTLPLAALILGLSYHLLNRTNYLSQRTRSMQKRFFGYLSVQVSVPFLCLSLPIFCLVLLMWTTEVNVQGDDVLRWPPPQGRCDTGVGNFALGACGLHGIIASTAIIFCNEPYRHFTLTLIMSRCKRNSRHVCVSQTTDRNIMQGSS
ncbi:hypothetical protein Y032_0352g3279 [Ancylostoma ceylanicum]|uniref:G-protein coupled receptors family 1 profile domain-containing protein n=1 Tax=Ancylostoma ceylanicum TaxID=53326 RepID=A0A016RXC7_9BILA|nr:hypothetical protein Y032_0352g3279 [Ancylostoma ceylanicum]